MKQQKSIEKNDIRLFNKYTLDISKLNKIINSWPKIIRNDRFLYMYDKNKKFYIEITDDSEKSYLDTLLYKTFGNIIPLQDDYGNKYNKFECLKLNQLNTLKNYIKKGFNFETKEIADSKYYNCINGVLNIETGELDKDHSKYFFNYKPVIYYNPKAKTDKLFDFINMVVTEDDPIDLVSKILGHIYYQGEKLQKGFLFLGTKHGRNGKGTLVKLIEKTIGEEITLTKPMKSFKRDSHATSALKDKILYIEDDYKDDYMNYETLEFLNKLISGLREDVNPKFKPSFEIKYKAIPIIQSNKEPKLKANDDGGFYLRFVIILFKNEFGNKMNEFLAIDLLNDQDVMSSMLNLLIAGYKKILYRKNNNIIGNFFKTNEISHINQWKIKNNSALQFVEECCNVNELLLCSSRALYKHYYDDWNLGSKKLSEKIFIQSIIDFYDIEKKRININGKKVTVLDGISCNEGNLINIENGIYI